MMKHLHPACFGNSVWIAAISALPALMSVYVPIGTTYGTSYPVLSESNGQFRMLSRPLIFTEKLGVSVGSKGELLLCDFSQYCVAMRKEVRRAVIGVNTFISARTKQPSGGLFELMVSLFGIKL